MRGRNPYQRPDMYMREAQFRRPPVQQFYPHGVTPPGFRGDTMWNGTDGSNGGDDGVDASGWGGSYWYPEPPIREMPDPRFNHYPQGARPPGFSPGAWQQNGRWDGTYGQADNPQWRMNFPDAAGGRAEEAIAATGDNFDIATRFNNPWAKGLNFSGISEDEWDAQEEKPYWEAYYPLMNFWRKEDPQY